MGEASQHDRFVVAHIEIVCGAFKLYADDVACPSHSLGVCGNEGQCVASLYVNIVPVGHIALLVGHDDGYGVVALDNTGHEREVGLFVSVVVGMHGLCPYFHLCLLLGLQVAHQIMRDKQRDGRNYNGGKNKYNLDLPYTVSPLHVSSFRKSVYLNKYQSHILSKNKNQNN